MMHGQKNIKLGTDVFPCLTYAVAVMFQTVGPLAAFGPFKLLGQPAKLFKKKMIMRPKYEY